MARLRTRARKFSTILLAIWVPAIVSLLPSTAFADSVSVEARGGNLAFNARGYAEVTFRWEGLLGRTKTRTVTTSFDGAISWDYSASIAATTSAHEIEDLKFIGDKKRATIDFRKRGGAIELPIPSFKLDTIGFDPTIRITSFDATSVEAEVTKPLRYDGSAWRESYGLTLSGAIRVNTVIETNSVQGDTVQLFGLVGEAVLYNDENGANFEFDITGIEASEFVWHTPHYYCLARGVLGNCIVRLLDTTIDVTLLEFGYDDWNQARYTSDTFLWPEAASFPEPPPPSVAVPIPSSVALLASALILSARRSLRK